MRTQEQLGCTQSELSEQSRTKSGRVVEALRAQWLDAPNRTHVIESKEN